ncbi:hypothetical protein VIOR3934_06609 [Vibrio orientalis CIP 102891 = ATCC 33934]|uniref:Uncharacterized protein n=1 Tax=Vibrio orientalis CIP 102891 = ATCC 33934 TaxID=675816 RepID=F9SQ96_VIBOR|nr:hypothetical protein VIOR3934_06609 [Vibrio orientalis CIP 102891 = ATCC 33934]
MMIFLKNSARKIPWLLFTCLVSVSEILKLKYEQARETAYFDYNSYLECAELARVIAVHFQLFVVA